MNGDRTFEEDVGSDGEEEERDDETPMVPDAIYFRPNEVDRNGVPKQHYHARGNRTANQILRSGRYAQDLEKFSAARRDEGPNIRMKFYHADSIERHKRKSRPAAPQKKPAAPQDTRRSFLDCKASDDFKVAYKAVVMGEAPSWR